MLSPFEIALELRGLYRSVLPSLVNRGKALIHTLPRKNHLLVRIVFRSLCDRLFLMLNAIHENFQIQLEHGYFTTASLTRSVMEISTVLALLNRDSDGTILSQMWCTAEEEAKSRQNELAKLKSAENRDVAKAASAETLQADMILQELHRIRERGFLPPVSSGLPNMKKRCEILGEFWQFMYEASYRELCEAVHTSFLEIEPEPFVFSGGRGAAPLYEHSQATNYAVVFWAYTVMDCCKDHPTQKMLEDFRERVHALLVQASSITDKFSAQTRNPTLRI